MDRRTDYTVLSFDCYGTLIDWERGLMQALAGWLARHDVQRSRDDVLEAYARYEARHEAATPRRLYSEILASVHEDLAREFGVEPSPEDARRFARSIADWLPFPDTVESLRYLRQHYKLVILSNVDHVSFRETQRHLEVEFDHVFTAEEIGSYKPDRHNFEYMLEALAREGIGASSVLHTAQSLYHDHVPASSLGLATNWIDRRHAERGFGATPRPREDVDVTFRHTSLADFVEHHRRELAARSSAR